MLSIEKIMEELNVESEEEIIEMMNDRFNTNPIIVALRELFNTLDNGSDNNEEKK